MLISLILIWVFSFILLEILFCVGVDVSFTRAFYDELMFKFPPIIWYNNIFILGSLIFTLISLPFATLAVAIVWILDNK